jgi:hypothetical protein
LGFGDCAVEATVEDVVDDEQQEHCGPGQLMGVVAEPPIGESEEKKAGCGQVECKAQEKNGIQGTALRPIPPACR